MSSFLGYIQTKKDHFASEEKILDGTVGFLRKNIHNYFILLDVAKHFNINLKTARRTVEIWKKFKIIESVSTSRLPKSYRVLEVPLPETGRVKEKN